MDFKSSLCYKQCHQVSWVLSQLPLNITWINIRFKDVTVHIKGLQCQKSSLDPFPTEQNPTRAKKSHLQGIYLKHAAFKYLQ